MCDADELSHWLTRYRSHLKAPSSLSALPDVMLQQQTQFMVSELVSLYLRHVFKI